MPLPLTLRPATTADTDALLGVWRRAVEATHHFLSPADIAGLDRLIREVYLGAVAVTVAVGGAGASAVRGASTEAGYSNETGAPAVPDDVVLGFVGIVASDGGLGGVVNVEMLFVDPSAHGQGVGTALLEEVCTGATTILVDVNEQNPSALGYYLSRGFVQVGRSDTDGEGNPFPILNLRRDSTAP